MAIGQQDGFDWKGVALSALGAGVSAGVGQAAQGAGDVWWASKTNDAAIATRAAMGNAISQGIGVATGLQDSFNWRGVAASAVGAVAGHEVGTALSNQIGQKGMEKFGNQLAVGTMAGIAGGVAAKVVVGGKIDFARIATDAFGNAIGSSFAEQMEQSGQQPAKANPPIDEKINAIAAKYRAESEDSTATTETDSSINADVNASSSSPATSIVLTNAQKAERLKAAIPDAIASIENASSNDKLDTAEKADLNASLTALHDEKINYKFDEIIDQPSVNGGAAMKNGKATITFTPSAAGLFNEDGTVNTAMMSSILVHEGRHIYDDTFYGLSNGPTNINEDRLTERNAYRTEAAYSKATDYKVSIQDLSKAYVPLTSETANIAAENSVKSWVHAKAVSADMGNKAIDKSYEQYKIKGNQAISDYNKKWSTNNVFTPQPRQPYFKIPVYSPPPNY